MRALLVVGMMLVAVSANAATPKSKANHAPDRPAAHEAAPVDMSTGAEYDPAVCGLLENAYGPFDFRTVSKENRERVETYHYNHGAERLRRREWYNNRGPIWGEFDYTLRAMPNHYGSLAALDKVSMELKSDKPHPNFYSALCYFLRATTFVPDDAMVRLLFGHYLLRRNRFADALEQLNLAESLSEGDRNILYNLGLAYFRMKDYPKAREYAYKAYAAGFPLPGLKNMLGRVGEWREPEKRADQEKTQE